MIYINNLYKRFNPESTLKIAKFASSIDPDEAAHDELPHLALHCLLSNLRNVNMIELDHQTIF